MTVRCHKAAPMGVHCQRYATIGSGYRTAYFRSLTYHIGHAVSAVERQACQAVAHRALVARVHVKRIAHVMRHSHTCMRYAPGQFALHVAEFRP